MTDITRDIAVKVRDTVDAGLVSGVGKPTPGAMCVEAAVCYALGLPHGDDPKCVATALRALKIRLNDSQWSSPQARAAGLRRLALIQLGSAGHLDEDEFVRRVAEMTIRRVVPAALRGAAKVNPTHADTLEAAAIRCEQEGSLSAAQAARTAARTADAAAYAAATYAADAAATYAANANAAANAANSNAAAAYAATYAADAANSNADAANSNAAARTRDRVLADSAEWVVQILIEMDVPGVQWLDLVPLAEAI